MAFVVPFLFGAVVALFGDVPLAALKALDWRSVGLWVLAYVVVGVAWGVVRWFLHALKRRAFFYDRKREWADRRGLPDHARIDVKSWADRAHQAEFLSWFAEAWNDPTNRMSNGDCRVFGSGSWVSPRNGACSISAEEMASKVMEAVIPKATREKARITLWMAFWPFSILCYCLQDLVVDFWRTLCRGVVRVAHGINAVVFRGMRRELGG